MFLNVGPSPGFKWESCNTAAGLFFAGKRLLPHLPVTRALVQESLRKPVNQLLTITEFLPMVRGEGYNLIVKFCSHTKLISGRLAQLTKFLGSLWFSVFAGVPWHQATGTVMESAT
jgi:hypothetical protein